MAIFWSSQTGGFYDTQIHAAIPFPSVEISQETWQNLLAGQGVGMQIVSDAAGYPTLIKPQPTKEQAAILFQHEVQAQLDAVAKEWGYASVADAASYISSKKRGTEAQKLIDWRDEVWDWAIPFVNQNISQIPAPPQKAST